MERRALQGILLVLSLVPVLGLALTWWQGPQLFFGDAAVNIPTSLDNQLRYLAGVYFGAVSLSIWWALPRIEERGLVITIAAVAIFVGGLGRCVSMVSVGLPDDPSMIGGVVLEMLVVPILALWQRRLARRSNAQTS
jgi:hypothetical protein